MKILDLGCGRGWLTEILSKYGDIIGIDLSVNFAKRTFPHLEFKQANIILNRIEGNYDIVVSSEVIEHLTSEHQRIYVKKTYELLNKDGYLILTTPNKLEVEKLINNSLMKREQLQPIENWLNRNSLLSLLSPYFKIKFIGSVMFYPLYFRKHRLLNLAYEVFYHRLGGYKLIDFLLSKTKRSDWGLYLVIWGKKKSQ